MCVFSFPCALAYTKDSLITLIKMYTRCPICKTNFSVSEAQLQVAQGKVRCGSCKNVFNARQHIHYRSTSPTSRKSAPKITTSAVPTKKPDVHFSSPTKPPLPKKTKPNENISQQNTSRVKHAELFEPPPKSKSTSPSSIDAIFNALDSQLTSGTYIDIAKPADTDIREADFDDDDGHFNQDNHLVSQQQFEADTNEPDLNLEGAAQAKNNTTIQTSTADFPTSIKTQSIKQKPEEKKGPQHTFDFANIASKPELSLKDKDKEHDEKQNENAALHQAIDNIIKVDNHITTPFEEHDDDHFVIETETQPDVELVDENDIDKLFASTDSLKISDLKFDKYLTNNQTEEPISILNQNNVKLKMQSIKKESLTENETSFNLQVEKQLKPESFESESSDSLNIDPIDINPKNPASANLDNIDDYDEIDFDSDFSVDNTVLDTDNFDIEEEIVLTSPETNPASLSDSSSHNIPHQLRGAVASFDLQTPPPSVAKRFFYSFASLILTLLLATQLVLFKSTALANGIPALQPLLTSLCNKLPCRYTGNHDSRQIKIISRDVRLHPKIKGALLISATIINKAHYAQPYPTILLKFTDLTGNTVAQRYFSPKDYLGLLNKPFALMPSKKPVQLNIEILDPGSDAINFQFFFL